MLFKELSTCSTFDPLTTSICLYKTRLISINQPFPNVRVIYSKKGMLLKIALLYFFMALLGQTKADPGNKFHHI